VKKIKEKTLVRRQIYGAIGIILAVVFYMSPEIFLNMYVLQGVLSPAVNAKMPALWWRLPEMKIMAGSIPFAGSNGL